MITTVDSKKNGTAPRKTRPPRVEQSAWQEEKFEELIEIPSCDSVGPAARTFSVEVAVGRNPDCDEAASWGYFTFSTTEIFHSRDAETGAPNYTEETVECEIPMEEFERFADLFVRNLNQARKAIARMRAEGTELRVS